jgi:hypothetical protein
MLGNSCPPLPHVSLSLATALCTRIPAIVCCCMSPGGVRVKAQNLELVKSPQTQPKPHATPQQASQHGNADGLKVFDFGTKPKRLSSQAPAGQQAGDADTWTFSSSRPKCWKWLALVVLTVEEHTPAGCCLFVGSCVSGENADVTHQLHLYRVSC